MREEHLLFPSLSFPHTSDSRVNNNNNLIPSTRVRLFDKITSLKQVPNRRPSSTHHHHSFLPRPPENVSRARGSLSLSRPSGDGRGCIIYFKLWTLFFSRLLCFCASSRSYQAGRAWIGEGRFIPPASFFLYQIPSSAQLKSIVIDRASGSSVHPSTPPAIIEVAYNTRSLLFLSLGCPRKFFSPYPTLRIIQIQLPLQPRLDHACAMLCFTVYEYRSPVFPSPSHIELRLSPGSPSVSS